MRSEALEGSGGTRGTSTPAYCKPFLKEAPAAPAGGKPVGDRKVGGLYGSAPLGGPSPGFSLTKRSLQDSPPS